ncbi:MAG TPA: hypothetical protein VHB98_02610 [Chloroflexota bacterium]|nr:hypothetical protein [Chloroflexota bacterium]
MVEMTHLVEAMGALGLEGEIAMAGMWVVLRGERCTVYVVEAGEGSYLTWCALPGERTVEAYPDPVQAIQCGLRRGQAAQ